MKKARIAVVALAVLMLFAAVSCKEPHVHSYGDPQVKDGKVIQVCECGDVKEVDGAVAVGTESELRTAVENGSKTIYLSDDVTLTGMMEINGGKSVEINLNGKTISITDDRINIQNAKVFIEGKGELVRTGDTANSLFWLYGSMDDVQDYTVLTIGKDVTIRAPYAISVNKNSDKTNTEGRSCGVVVNLQGSIVAEVCGLYVNGTLKSSVCAPVFNLTDVVVKSNGCGIYAAGYAKWNIKDTTIEGVGSAIEIRAGELNIEGGKYSASATPTAVAPNGNGTTSSGAAIAVAQHETQLPISVNISGGVFEGYSALYESNPQGNDADSIAKVKLNVVGGSFASTASDKKCAVYSEDFTGFIVGGTYNSDPTAYVATGYKASESEGVWNVVAE